MASSPIVPADLAFAADGTPFSPTYGDVYYSASGALAQARHVFLNGNDLPARWANRAHFAIFETGFGIGANFLATWQAWRDDPRRSGRLHYFSLEKHPFRTGDLARLHAPLAAVADIAAELRTAWPSLVGGFHRLHFECGRIALTLLFGDVRQTLPGIDGCFDAFFLDGFSPEKNPEMWAPSLMRDLAWLAAPGATAATWTISRPVRDGLSAAGFAISAKPGFGSKRDMLAATYVGDRLGPAPAIPTEHRAAVVGAGVAGVACAERLAARGWQVDLFDRRENIAEETSGNRQAVLLPALAVDETRLSRLNRVAFLYALRRLRELNATGHPVVWSDCGVFQLARDAAHARKQQAIIADQRLPDDFARYLDAADATTPVGTEVAASGWWFPQAGWVAPVSLCRALLAAAGETLAFRGGTTVAEARADGERWRLLDADGNTLWQGGTLIFANAHGLRELAQSAHLPIRCFRGQVSHLPAERLGGLPRCVVCREGYLTPPFEGFAGLGATFQRSRETALALADHEANLNRLASMLPALSERFRADELTGRVGLRPVSPDKLPMVGALPLPVCAEPPAAHADWPRWPGLYVASGYGARGFVWAPLMAELLASQICGEPLPVEAELAAAVDPARFPFREV